MPKNDNSADASWTGMGQATPCSSTEPLDKNYGESPVWGGSKIGDWRGEKDSKPSSSTNDTQSVNVGKG